MNMADTAAFHRTGSTGLFGKRTEGVKCLVSIDTKALLQKRCADLGITESEFTAILIEAAVHGRDHVHSMQRARIDGVLGTVPE